MTYRALVVERTGDDEAASASVRDLDRPFALPNDDGLTIDVAYSSINYKDAIALTGGRGILRELPMTAGIDAVGTVREDSAGWEAGQPVLVNGAGIGERVDGGLAERVVAPTSAAIAVPSPFSPRDAAAIGTAGFTAALSVLALERLGVAPEAGPVLVTGAGGGVGSFAIALLSARGYAVTASTGRIESRGPGLRQLGAAELVDRTELGEAGKPLQSARWAAVVDSVGGAPLANAIAQTRYGGVVTACGLAAGADLPATVLPFILRGVTLAGINSVDAPAQLRADAWSLLASALTAEVVGSISPRTVGLAEAAAVASDVLAGKVEGRVTVDVRA